MDEDDIFPELFPVTALKTYPKATKKPKVELLDIDFMLHEPLTTKNAVKFLLEGNLKTKVCRFCLHKSPALSELDQVMQIAGTGSFYKVTIRAIVATVYPFKVVADANFPDKICQKCLDKAINAYLFAQQCERSERALLNCFDDIYAKFEKLDPVDRPKKRGRQKLHPNHNIIHAEHLKVIDYADPIINMINIQSESFTKEPELNQLECKKCHQVLPSIDSLFNHEKIHPKTMWYHCRLCGKSFPRVNQLKKHNLQVHIQGKHPKLDVDTMFRCKECLHATENYVQHLQHIEKHRFKSLMTNLLEKRMNKLCAVCLDDSPKMVDLDEMVGLHGGHEELMGDKTLYNVLAATLPGHKPYKYQELYVSHPPRIMTITKKRLHKEAIQPQYNIKGNKKFILSYPDVISEKEFDIDDNNKYLFVFSDPIKAIDANNKDTENIINEIFEYKKENSVIQNLSEEETIMTEESDVRQDIINQNKMNTKLTVDNKIENDINDMNIHKVEINSNIYLKEGVIKFSSPKLIRKDNNIVAEIKENENLKLFRFSEPEYENQANTLQTKMNNSCAKCWIFNKPCDMKCIATEYLDRKDSKEEECKLCWVFKHLDNCGNCTKPIAKYNDNNPQIKNIVNTDTVEAKFEPNNNNITTFKTYQNINKKVVSLWQCSVCLTNNTAKTQTCLCCDSKLFTDKNIKITFGTKTFMKANTINEKYEELTRKTQNMIEDGATINLNTNKVYKENEAMAVSPIILSNIDNLQNMDIEGEVTEESNMNTITPYIEAMDIEENSLPYNINNTMAINTMATNILPYIGNNLQFHIGCTFNEGRAVKNNKRAWRNVSKAFHK